MITNSTAEHIFRFQFMTDIWFHRFYDNFKIGEDRSAPLYVYEFAHIASNDRIRIAGNQKIIQNGKLRHE